MFGLEKRGRRSQIISYEIRYTSSAYLFLILWSIPESTATFVVFIDFCSSCEQLCQLLQEQDVEKRGLPEEEGETKA